MNKEATEARRITEGDTFSVTLCASVASILR